MNRLVLGVWTVGVLAGCIEPPGQGPDDLDETTAPDAFRVDAVGTGLDTVWALAFAPDGRLFLTERPGRIRVIDAAGNLDPTPWATLDVAEQGESGLMGLALDPDFVTNGHVYVYYTQPDDAGEIGQNVIARLTEAEGRGHDLRIVLDGIPASSNHDGGRLKFGPDGKLYATTGDAQQTGRAQDDDSLGGKILRLNPDGTIPADNPDRSSYVYTKGHRNPQGLCWNPRDGRLYSTEHGPDTDDEVNLIVPGDNYGWPDHRGAGPSDRYFPALTAWTPTIAPAGCTFYDAGLGGHAAWANSMLFVTLKEKDLRRLVVDPDDPRRIVGEEVLLDEDHGRLRDVIQAPDGDVYIATSNLDGRGGADASPDKVLRLAFG